MRIGAPSLYHCGRTVGGGNGEAVRLPNAGAAGEDVGLAVLTAQHHPLGKYHEAAQCHGAGGSHNGIGKDSVIECNVNAVVIPVKGHRLHIEIGVEQVRAAYLGTGSGVQQVLRSGGKIDPQVLDAIFITAGIRNLLGVYG